MIRASKRTRTAVVLLGVVITLVAVLVTRDQLDRRIDRHVNRALDSAERSISQVAGVADALMAAGEATVRASGGDPEVFETVLEPRIFNDVMSTNTWLLRAGASGRLGLLAGQPPPGAPSLTEPPTEAQMTLGPWVTTTAGRLLFSVGRVVDGVAPTNVVMVGVDVPESIIVGAGPAPADGVDYSVYLGDPIDAELLVTSADEPPDRSGASGIVRFGDETVSIVATTNGNHRSTLLRMLPWIVALIGAVLIAMALAWLHRRSLGLMERAQQRRREETLQLRASHDPLTGLENRTALLDRLRWSLEAGSLSAVLFIDLDDFKVVNDSLGHGFGDQLLVAVADRLRLALDPEVHIARFGGDEFVVAVNRPLDAISTAESVTKAISGAIAVGEFEAFLTTSVGVRTIDDDERSPDVLLRDADAAMYEAKAAGRGKVAVFDESIRVKAVDRLETESAARRALRDDELELHFQPIVDAVERTLFGYEVLVRWDHPSQGLLQPRDFLPNVGEAGLQTAIDDWVIDHTCVQLQSVPSLVGQLACVNISAASLHRRDLDGLVAAAADRHDLALDRLCVEITEEALLQDIDAVAALLRRLKAMGVTISVDDFGTGYSSLTYLRRFPIDMLKVDVSFIRALEADERNRTIVSSVIELAHRLDIRVVAEGVETDAQLDILQGMGCDLVQGSQVAAPKPARELESLGV